MELNLVFKLKGRGNKVIPNRFTMLEIINFIDLLYLRAILSGVTLIHHKSNRQIE